MPVKKRNRVPTLTRRQKEIVDARVSDPLATHAELGKKVGIQRQNISAALRKPHIKQAIIELMDATPKLRNEALLRKVEQGLDAHETKFFAHEGEIVSTRKTVDFGTRHKYLDTALRLRGELRNDAPVTNIALFTPAVLDSLIEARRLKQKL